MFCRTTAFTLSILASLAACSDSADTTDVATPNPTAGGASAAAGAPGAPAVPGVTAAPAKDSVGPYPVVLLHGMGGFDHLHLGPAKIEYWNSIAEDLAKNGETRVFVTQSSPFDASEARAAQIAIQLDAILKETGAAKVNLVGHSQGGLDARVLASPAGLALGDRIASVTTISTPHRGSRVADVLLGLVSGLPTKTADDVANGLLRLIQKTSYDLQNDPKLRAQGTALSEDFTTKIFNVQYVDDSRVRYMSYAGRSNLQSGKGICDTGLYPNAPSKLDVAQPALAALGLFLQEGEGKPNDGLVTVESAIWGQFMECVPADHLDEIGLPGTSLVFDHRAFYRGLVKRLRDSGL